MNMLEFLKNLNPSDLKFQHRSGKYNAHLYIKGGGEVVVDSPGDEDIAGQLERLSEPTEEQVWIAEYDTGGGLLYQPCEREKDAYEWLAQQGLEYARDEFVLPEDWLAEDLVQNWYEITGDQYMQVRGPYSVFRCPHLK